MITKELWYIYKHCLEELNELTSLLQRPLAAGDVSRGSEVRGSGLVVNDLTFFAERILQHQNFQK